MLKWKQCSQKEESGHWARATGIPGTGPPQGERSHRAELQPLWSPGGLLPRQRGGHAVALGLTAEASAALPPPDEAVTTDPRLSVRVALFRDGLA